VFLAICTINAFSALRVAMFANPAAMMLPLIKPEIAIDDRVSMSKSPGDIVGASE
jgi:hypothetical protein